MSKPIKKLPLDGRVELISKIADDFDLFVNEMNFCPSKLTYSIEHSEEPPEIKRSARKAALSSLCGNFIKTALDTRRVDQTKTRNPRTNTQYYHRSQQFIDDELDNKIKIFAKLYSVLQDIDNNFNSQPEYFESYARVLYDTVGRIIQVKTADAEIFRPQINYLEQLLFARYRLTIDDLVKCSESELKKKVLDKDENLLKRGAFLYKTDSNKGLDKQALIIKDNDRSMQENLVNAIFGNSNFRRDGEKTVTRSITITIKDTVED